MIGLTLRQAQCLDAIKAHIAAHWIAPSYRELQAALGLASLSGVHRLLAGLEERGHIRRRLRRRPRAIEVVDQQARTSMTTQERAVIEAAVELAMWREACHYGPGREQLHKAERDLDRAVSDLHAEHDGRWS